jgi:hypothetical protein
MYNIIKEYRVIDYAHCMWKLYDELNTLITSKFPNGKINFNPEERIVFWHTDLDYFINGNFPGFWLYNLQLILRELDVPNFTCAVVSNMPDYDRYTKMVRDIIRPDDVPMRAITFFPEMSLAKKISNTTKINLDSLQFSFTALSRLNRPHRTLFMAKLFDRGLQHQGLVAYHNIKDKNVVQSSGMLPDITKQSHPTFLTTNPFTLCNNDNVIIDASNRKLFNDFTSSTTQYCNFVEEEVDISVKNIAMEYQNNVIQQGLVYVGLETVANYPTAFQSGISFKGICQQRPFIIFGAPGSIQMLRNQGFQTFGRWWDESYDDDSNMESRTDKIIDIIQYLAGLDISKLKILCKEMSTVLEYNYQYFIGDFIKKEYSRYQAVLDQNFIKY